MKTEIFWMRSVMKRVWWYWLLGLCSYDACSQRRAREPSAPLFDVIPASPNRIPRFKQQLSFHISQLTDRIHLLEIETAVYAFYEYLRNINSIISERKEGEKNTPTMSDEETLTTSHCLPFMSLTEPIEVSELRYYFFFFFFVSVFDIQILHGSDASDGLTASAIDRMGSPTPLHFSNGRFLARSYL